MVKRSAAKFLQERACQSVSRSFTLSPYPAEKKAEEVKRGEKQCVQLQVQQLLLSSLHLFTLSPALTMSLWSALAPRLSVRVCVRGGEGEEVKR